MTASLPDRLRLRAAGTLLCLAGGLQAAIAAPPRQIEAFEPGTWQAWQNDLKRPAVVVFTTTDCAHCPAVIADLAQQIRRRKGSASLAAVVMDVTPGEADALLLSEPHYRPLDRLMAFNGQAPALRHGVDPRWRGVTPFVVFLRPNSPALRVTGPPSAADIEAGLRPMAKPGRDNSQPGAKIP